MPEERQYGHQQSYDGFANYDIPVVGDVVGQYRPVLEYPVPDYQVPVYDQWSGLPPCNPSPSRYLLPPLLPPLLPDCGDYYDCPPPLPPCTNCPCVQFDPCAPPYFCPPPTAPTRPPRPASTTATPTATSTTVTASSCSLENGERESLMVGVDGVLLWLSAPHSGLSWYRADSLTAALGRDTSDWKLAEINTRDQLENLELLLNREGCE